MNQRTGLSKNYDASCLMFAAFAVDGSAVYTDGCGNYYDADKEPMSEEAIMASGITGPARLSFEDINPYTANNPSCGW